MAGNYSVWRSTRTTLAILLATACSAQFALGQYTWVNPTTNSALWADAANWTGGGAGTYPNAVGATVLINAPTRTGGSGNFNLTMPASDVTVGELKVDNTNFADTFRSNFTNGGDAFRLIFDSGTSTPAKYTETIGSAIGAANSQYQFLGRIRVNSDLIINQDNYPNLNTGTTFANLVEGAANRTIYKEGHGGIQFNYTAFTDPPFNETPFQGKFVINQGGIRLLTPSPISNSAGVTVNSGGQLMLADNANNTGNANWNLASGAVLNLNGPGKALDSPQTVANADGALRFALAQAASPVSTNFNNAVVLQSDSVISVIAGATTTTGVLAGVVSGSGGLTKHGNGTLELSNASDLYGGDTKFLSGGGTLKLDNPILADGRDVYLVTGTILNLNFGTTDTIRSLYLDGVAQQVGTYSNSTSGFSSLITGSGSLNVTTVPVVGVPGDYNNNGFVDAGDYVVWRKGGPLANEVDTPGTVNAQDYTEWRARFGNPPGSGSALSGATVPEPATFVLLMLIAPFFAGRNLGRTRS